MPQLRLLGPGMLRFILAAMVVVSHLTSLNIGRPAVLLFFMLSGYWVSRLLAGWQASVPAFYASRTLRVWPLYAVTTVVAWLLHAHATPVRPESLWSALTLLGLAARPGDVIGVSWSLDIELQFYLAVPLIALAAQRLSPRWLLAMAVAAFGLGIALFAARVPTLLFYLPAFLAGFAFYRLHWQPGPGLVGASLAAAAAFTLAAATVPGLGGLLFKAEFTDSLAQNLGHMAWILLLAPFVAWNINQPSDRLDRWLGDLSYPLYLVHLPVVRLLAEVVPVTDAGGKLVAVAAIMVVSIALFIGVDRPLEARRQRLWRRARPA
jgi:peptidoglycan/LPS O-acetylase OafA/YrhL